MSKVGYQTDFSRKDVHMKRLLQVASIISVLNIAAQPLRAQTNAISEVAAVPFGSSREQTVERLTNRFGMTMTPSLQKPSELYFTGGEFAGVAVSSWWFRFASNKL